MNERSQEVEKPIMTTLNNIRKCLLVSKIGWRKKGWKRLLSNLGKTKADDEPFAISAILESHGLFEAIRCLRELYGCDREIRLYAVKCAREVQHLMTDQRSLDALDIAERFANGKASTDELTAASIAAWDVVWATAEASEWACSASVKAAKAAAWAVAVDVGDTARSVRDSAWAAELTAALNAAKAIVGNAAWNAASGAAWDAARDAARDAATTMQHEMFIQMCNGELFND